VPRLITNDATPEAIARVLANNGERVMVAEDEGTVFEILQGRYNEGRSCSEIMLKGHAGSQHIVDRIGRDTIMLKAPAITIGVAVQPHVFRALVEDETLRERGFPARVLIVLPKSRVGTRKTEPAPIPLLVRAKYQTVIDKLWRDHLKSGEKESIVTLVTKVGDTPTITEGAVWQMYRENRENKDVPVEVYRGGQAFTVSIGIHRMIAALLQCGKFVKAAGGGDGE
jgi:hypothetical protein